jgi:micrococcal nuclease
LNPIPMTIIVFLSVFAIGVQGITAQQWPIVTHVYDGDTIVISDGRRIRYLGIDAPETGRDGGPPEPYAQEAEHLNRRLTISKGVRLEVVKERHDRYGRTLAYLFLKDGTFVNLEIVERGMAFCLFSGTPRPYDGLLLSAQQRAMLSRKGLWGNLKEKAPSYIANTKSKRFHNKNCSFGLMIKPKNRLNHAHIRDLFWKGYAPCRQCLKKSPHE